MHFNLLDIIIDLDPEEKHFELTLISIGKLGFMPSLFSIAYNTVDGFMWDFLFIKGIFNHFYYK
jgi:hypothetical protein